MSADQPLQILVALACLCSLVESGSHSPFGVLILLWIRRVAPEVPKPQDYTCSGSGGNAQYLPQNEEFHNGWFNSASLKIKVALFTTLDVGKLKVNATKCAVEHIVSSVWLLWV
ncbi:hypothetical protein BTVI_35939 [Pitangus sulphuratus]|nr:hypothetical protein BTVI_35939 [Pitangus sulphuratus]